MTGELVEGIKGIEEGKNLQVMEGNRIVEVKSADVDKGKVASYFLTKKGWDFILGLGDDTTDEDMFGAMPKEAYSIKVGLGTSKARFNLKSVKDVRQFLRGLGQ